MIIPSPNMSPSAQLFKESPTASPFDEMDDPLFGIDFSFLDHISTGSPTTPDQPPSFAIDAAIAQLHLLTSLKFSSLTNEHRKNVLPSLQELPDAFDSDHLQKINTQVPNMFLTSKSKATLIPSLFASIKDYEFCKEQLQEVRNKVNLTVAEISNKKQQRVLIA
ncbi:hypothetical protein JCGZ_00352 [Jatropha curcas]|uniref:Uncharacterized protein n=1 Tax=Jatropha curcas TaxID=180498 RepID=A0A067JJZ3_JATCU|nr:hypothetical protein JCGZ_00352 [Jatropha curcas]